MKSEYDVANCRWAKPLILADSMTLISEGCVDPRSSPRLDDNLGPQRIRDEALIVSRGV